MKQSIGTKMENCIHVYYINYTEIHLPGDFTVIYSFVYSKNKSHPKSAY